jgi:hypothetical protein
MVLSAIERSLYSSKVEAVSLTSSLSLEHVMPQAWQSTWPLDADLPPEQLAEAEARRAQRIHRLGNLTLTTFPLNASLSNSPWPRKRQELNVHSVLLLNTELITRHPDSFDEASIDERTSLLARRVAGIWPGPMSDEWAEARPAGVDSADEAVEAQGIGPRVLSTDPGVPTATAPVEPEIEPENPPALRSTRAEDALAPSDVIVDHLLAGRTPDQIFAMLGRQRQIYLTAIEEEARLVGELGTLPATPETAAELRDDRGLRWERIAARVFGDARRTDDARALYDAARGEGAARRSYTGRGRRFPDMRS